MWLFSRRDCDEGACSLGLCRPLLGWAHLPFSVCWREQALFGTTLSSQTSGSVNSSMSVTYSRVGNCYPTCRWGFRRMNNLSPFLHEGSRFGCTPVRARHLLTTVQHRDGSCVHLNGRSGMSTYGRSGPGEPLKASVATGERERAPL